MLRLRLTGEDVCRGPAEASAEFEKEERVAYTGL